jgi:hypothetical protein
MSGTQDDEYEGVCCSAASYFRAKMEVASTFATSENCFQTASRNNSEDIHSLGCHIFDAENQ